MVYEYFIKSGNQTILHKGFQEFLIFVNRKPVNL